MSCTIIHLYVYNFAFNKQASYYIILNKYYWNIMLNNIKMLKLFLYKLWVYSVFH